MNRLVRVCQTIQGNEKAWVYLELHLQSPGSRGRRRYRIIVVNRDGYLAEYKEDMGPAKAFKGIKELNIPSLWEHSVDELMDLADELRNETKIDVKDWLELESYKPA